MTKIKLKKFKKSRKMILRIMMFLLAFLGIQIPVFSQLDKPATPNLSTKFPKLSSEEPAPPARLPGFGSTPERSRLHFPALAPKNPTAIPKEPNSGPLVIYPFLQFLDPPLKAPSIPLTIPGVEPFQLKLSVDDSPDRLPVIPAKKSAAVANPQKPYSVVGEKTKPGEFPPLTDYESEIQSPQNQQLTSDPLPLKKDLKMIDNLVQEERDRLAFYQDLRYRLVAFLNKQTIFSATQTEELWAALCSYYFRHRDYVEVVYYGNELLQRFAHSSIKTPQEKGNMPFEVYRQVAIAMYELKMESAALPRLIALLSNLPDSIDPGSEKVRVLHNYLWHDLAQQSFYHSETVQNLIQEIEPSLLGLPALRFRYQRFLAEALMREGDYRKASFLWQTAIDYYLQKKKPYQSIFLAYNICCQAECLDRMRQTPRAIQLLCQLLQNLHSQQGEQRNNVFHALNQLYHYYTKLNRASEFIPVLERGFIWFISEPNVRISMPTDSQFSWFAEAFASLYHQHTDSQLGKNFVNIIMYKNSHAPAKLRRSLDQLVFEIIHWWDEHHSACLRSSDIGNYYTHLDQTYGAQDWLTRQTYSLFSKQLLQEQKFTDVIKLLKSYEKYVDHDSSRGEEFEVELMHRQVTALMQIKQFEDAKFMLEKIFKLVYIQQHNQTIMYLHLRLTYAKILMSLSQMDESLATISEIVQFLQETSSPVKLASYTPKQGSLPLPEFNYLGFSFDQIQDLHLEIIYLLAENEQFSEATSHLHQMVESWVTNQQIPKCFDNAVHLISNLSPAIASAMGKISRIEELLKTLISITQHHPQSKNTEKQQLGVKIALAQWYYHSKNLHQSIAYAKEILQENRALLQKNPMYQKEIYEIIGSSYCNLGKVDQALKFFIELVEMPDTGYPGESEEKIRQLHIACDLAIESNQFKVAEQLSLQCYHLVEAEPIEESDEKRFWLNQLLEIYTNCKQFDKKIRLLKPLVDHFRQENKIGNHDSFMAWCNRLIIAYEEKKEYAKAIELRREVLQCLQETSGKRSLKTIEAVFRLAQMLVNNHHYAEAIPYLEEVQAVFQDILPASHPYQASLAAMKGYCLLRLGRTTEAEHLILHSLQLRQENDNSSWEYFSSMSLLGQCKLAAKEYTKVYPLLQKSLIELSKQRYELPAPTNENNILALTSQAMQKFQNESLPVYGLFGCYWKEKMALNGQQH